MHHEKGSVVARVQTDFGGVLPAIRRVQTSRMQPHTLSSQSYAEGDGRGRAQFETGFDARTGLITLRQGREEASAPLTTDHHDPVSLLLWLRLRCAGLGEGERLHAQLTGGRVLIQALPEIEVGGVSACGYYLRPGNAYVYVERAAPWRLLRLIQPTDFGPVEADLTGPTAPAPRKPQQERRRRRA